MIAQPKWYDSPEHVDFPVDLERMIFSPLGNEVSVNFCLCGQEYHVIIPTGQWDQSKSTIPAVKVGESEDMVLVSFPAT